MLRLSWMLKWFFLAGLISGCGRQNVSQVEEMVPCENDFGSDGCKRIDYQQRHRYEYFYNEKYLENTGINRSNGKFYDNSILLKSIGKPEKNILLFEFTNPEKFELIVEVPLKYVTYDYQHWELVQETISRGKGYGTSTVPRTIVSDRESVIAKVSLGVGDNVVDFNEHLPSNFKVTDTREEGVINLNALSNKDKEFINFNLFRGFFKSGGSLRWTKKETEKTLVLKTILNELPPEKNHRIWVDINVKGHGSVRVKPFKVTLQQL